MTCIVTINRNNRYRAVWMLNKPNHDYRKQLIESLDPEHAADLIACEKKRREQRKQDRRA